MMHNHVTHLHTMLIRVKVEMVMLTRHDKNYWSLHVYVFFFVVFPLICTIWINFLQMYSLALEVETHV